MALLPALLFFAAAASGRPANGDAASSVAPRKGGPPAGVSDSSSGVEIERRNPRPDDPVLVDVLARIPDAIADLRYATSNNFMKRAVYPPDARCLLRPATAEKLARVAARLRAEDGTRLVLYDCYRPHSVQQVMWDVVPIRGYVAPPKGGSIHNRGAAVDLGLATKDGTPLPMPSEYDEFSRKAWHAYDGATAEQAQNRKRLRDAMVAEGFQPIRMEWWHYEDPGERKSPLLDLPFDAAPR